MNLVHVVRGKNTNNAVESSMNSALYGFWTAEKLMKKVRFVNKNIKMWTKNIENKGM